MEKNKKSSRNIFKLLKAKIIFIIIGIASTAWFLIRVIPKPNRATYPCMQVAAPWASAFVVYLIGMGATIFSFKKFTALIKKSRYSLAVIFFFIGIFAGTVALFSSSMKSWAIGMMPPKGIVIESEPNQPVGEAKGMFPGRVVWVHNSEATNANCDPASFGNTWYRNQNNDQEVIDNMLSDALQALTETSSDTEAWEQLFKYHNETRGKGEVDYNEGEMIFIKINSVSTWPGNYDRHDLSDVDNGAYGIAETSPQLALALLRQLINNAGVKQSDIYIGDPMRRIYKYHFEMWTQEFPDVNYLDHVSNDLGRVYAEHGDAIIDYSDRGTIITEYGGIDNIYKIFEDCEYLLNLPVLKGHIRAGVTMGGKNHFGSHTRDDAMHLHNGLHNPDGNFYSGDERLGYGLYRVVVDFMGHELFNDKSLFHLMDALWSAGMEIERPVKWQMEPFNNHWSSSLFLSHDPVAIESVGYDFLKAEYTEEHGHQDTHVQMLGTDDYLFQAADSSYWPEGIQYDPENNGVILGSIGVHEYWNNPVDRQYSRNLETGDGIELIQIKQEEQVSDVIEHKRADTDLTVFPNPAGIHTNISLSNSYRGEVVVEVYNISGRLIDSFSYRKESEILEVKMPINQSLVNYCFIRVIYDDQQITKTLMLL